MSVSIHPTDAAAAAAGYVGLETLCIPTLSLAVLCNYYQSHYNSRVGLVHRAVSRGPGPQLRCPGHLRASYRCPSEALLIILSGVGEWARGGDFN